MLNGGGMCVHQAVEAFQLLTGIEPNVARMHCLLLLPFFFFFFFFFFFIISFIPSSRARSFLVHLHLCAASSSSSSSPH